MTETSAPLLLTDDSYVRWQTCTLRECGKDERFLEKVIGAHPQLLGLEDRRTNVHGPYVAFHQLRLDTPQGRTVSPDIVFLTESGHIIVVEVKLSDNGELGDRRVVAQLLDYAASISAYAESEIAALFGEDGGQSFCDVVRTRFPDATGPEELAAVLLERMRAAELHLVIACDGVSNGLREFVRGVTNQSALGSYELRSLNWHPTGRRSGQVFSYFLRLRSVRRSWPALRSMSHTCRGSQSLVLRLSYLPRMRWWMPFARPRREPCANLDGHSRRYWKCTSFSPTGRMVSESNCTSKAKP